MNLRAAFEQAFHDLGGVAGLVAWGRENPNLFYPLMARLPPSESKTEITAKASVYDEEAGRRVLADLLDRARLEALPHEPINGEARGLEYGGADAPLLTLRRNAGGEP